MAEAVVLAHFRRDLKLYAGPRDFDGSPTFNLYDPAADRYYKFNWQEAYIFRLTRPGMTLEDVAATLRKHTTIRLEEEDLKAFFQQANALGLLELGKSSQDVYRAFERTQSNPLWWAIKNYLYFRIPLVHPDNFLGVTLPYVRLFWSRTAIILYLIATVAGMMMVLNRWDEYVHTFSYFFNFQGFIAYSGAICCIKVVHEFSHAYTARNYGVYVPTMGVAFICLWPVLYTDVTSSWRLAKRSQRLAITIAGVAAELTIAGLSTLGWALSPPGLWQTTFFILSSITWVSSLFININPAMRFDGYYLLSDLWGIDNLRSRAFAVGRWKLHQWLFNLDLPCPEENLGPNKIRQLWAYSYFSWIYLLVVYVVIALFVYHAFAKVLGIILFIVEIAVFFVWPVVYEAQVLYRVREHLTLNRRLVTTCILATGVFLWLVLPWSHNLTFSAITVPERSQELWVPEDNSALARILVKRGSEVTKGQPLVEIANQHLFAEIQAGEAEAESMRQALKKMSAQEEMRSQLTVQQAEWDSVQDRLKGLRKRLQYLTLVADISGTVFDWNETLKEGMPVSKDEVLGKVADLSKVNAIAYVPETFYQAVTEGQEVEFRLPYSSIFMKGVVTHVDTVSTSYLEYPALASLLKGPLAVVADSEKRLRLTNTYYKVTVSLKPEQGEKPIAFGKVGNVVVESPPQSLLMRGLSTLWAIILRESGL